MLENIKDFTNRIKPKMIALYLGIALLGSGIIGFIVKNIVVNLPNLGKDMPFKIDGLLIFSPDTWLIGIIIVVFLWIILWVGTGIGTTGNIRHNLFDKKGKDDGSVESVLENSRFLTDPERDKFFPVNTYEQLDKAKKDGVPVRAIIDKKGKLIVNFYPGAHSLVIGATGSGKTTTFINPMIQLLGAAGCGSSINYD